MAPRSIAISATFADGFVLHRRTTTIVNDRPVYTHAWRMVVAYPLVDGVPMYMGRAQAQPTFATSGFAKSERNARNHIKLLWPTGYVVKSREVVALDSPAKPKGKAA